MCTENYGLTPKKNRLMYLNYNSLLVNLWGVWMVSEFIFYHTALNLISKKDGYK